MGPTGWEGFEGRIRIARQSPGSISGGLGAIASWAHVVVRVGDNLIASAITRRALELQLKKGDTVTAVVKATEVMIQKD
jgi:molybdopterin-binding protein